MSRKVLSRNQAAIRGGSKFHRSDAEEMLTLSDLNAEKKAELAKKKAEKTKKPMRCRSR